MKAKAGGWRHMDAQLSHLIAQFINPVNREMVRTHLTCYRGSLQPQSRKASRGVLGRAHCGLKGRQHFLGVYLML